MSERDCPHGHKLGKCDTCELIVAEKRIALLEAESHRLHNAAQKLLDACIAQRDAYYDSEYYAATDKKDSAMDELQSLLQEKGE